MSEQEPQETDEKLPEYALANVPLAWVGLEDVPVHFINHVTSQAGKDHFIVSFGLAVPPPFVGSTENQREQAKKIPYVPVRPVSRVAFTREMMEELIKALSKNLVRFDELRAALALMEDEDDNNNDNG